MYGVKKPSEYEKVESFTYKQWFQSVYGYILSRVNIANVTTSYSIVANVFYVRGDATAGAITITLPPAVDCGGRRIFIKKIDASANAVTISRSGSDTIEGANTMALAAQWNKQELISNGNNMWEKM